ncbi:MAG TPA: hypothetical protein VK689_21290, partial [Armatimonadota bacterium]|nr:hypothetical protein [Armatimonadota bacterium]
MRQSIASLAVALTLALLSGHPIQAAPAVTVVNGPQGARVKVDGKLVCLFRTPNGTLSAEQRAARAANRLRKLIPLGLGPEHVEVRLQGKTWGVYAADELVMVATAGEAA